MNYQSIRQPISVAEANRQAGLSAPGGSAAPQCKCQERIKAALPGVTPSDGHDWVDEIIGLLRVTRGQRDDYERQLLKQQNDQAL